MASNKDDWEDVPLDQGQDDWEDQPVDSVLPSMDTALETGQDFLTGASQGATLGFADELGGSISALLEKGAGKLGFGPSAVDEQLEAQGFDIEGNDLADVYRQYQQAGEQASDLAKERSPYAEFAGQLGGAALSSTALGLNPAAVQGPKALLSTLAANKGAGQAALALLRGTATSGSRIADAAARGVGMFGQAAPALALESVGTSKSDLVGPEADLGGVAEDVATGLSFGLPAMVGLNVAADAPGALKEKVGQKLEPIKEKVAAAFADEGNPRLRQMAKSFQEYGRDLGIHPRSHAADIAGPKFAQKDSKAASQLLNIVDTADAKLGQEVGESVQKATARGALIDIAPDIQAAAQRVNELTSILPDLGATRKSAAAFDKILNGMSQLTPIEVKNLIDDLDAAIGTFKSATNKDPAAIGTLNELLRHRKSVSETFKKAVPEYADASQRFESFRQVLEQIMSGDRPADVTQIFYGTQRNQDTKVYDKLLDMIQNVQKTGQAAQSHRTAFTNFMDALQAFEQKELSRAVPKQPVLPSSSAIRKNLLSASDDSVLRSSVRSTTESRSVVPDLKEAIVGKAPTSGAFWAGKLTKNIEKKLQSPVVKGTTQMSKIIYNAPAQALSNLASKLETSGSFQQVGKALREAVENGDTTKKNAALFTIMQNPNARAFISAEDFPDVDSEE